ncbi:hypothetical protein E2C01_000816 [Portunus trituberculatus]|uniref:Uncharacterized protein n=1 Tax=Portunus trituberculatus TaxID=210409 RepID=A0A5B7CG49_PORTR|nr:hypothetical protein [Portunus trituberculatus]
MEYSLHVWEEGVSTHTVLLDRVESKAIHLINSSSRIVSLTATMLHLFLPSTAFFMPTALWILLTTLLWPHCTRLSSSSHPHSVHLSNARVTNTFNHSYLSLVNSGTSYLLLYFHFPMACINLIGKSQDINSFLLNNSLRPA